MGAVKAFSFSSRRSRASSARRRNLSGAEQVPKRFMGPRLLLEFSVFCLVAFGCIMIYSASSVSALSEYGDTAHYLVQQVKYAAAGLILLLILAAVDYRIWSRAVLAALWLVTVVMLLMVWSPIAGKDAYGASRWLQLGSVTFQPSELAKVLCILNVANLAEEYYVRGSIGLGALVGLIIVGVLVPTGLVLLQPDKGTSMVLVATVLIMAYLAGVSGWTIFRVFLVLGILYIAYAFTDDYSRSRIYAMLDPWADPYDSAYQLIQGFYAFASGGLFGVGIGFSRQKYSYLPLAHNDFIFAIIGEECGLMGTLGVLAAFALFAWAGLKIAREAPDLTGRLIASGSTVMIILQMLLNMAGVLGVFPLSGKPIPFLSYGGSSILISLMLVGLILSVSRHSDREDRRPEQIRESWEIREGGEARDFYDAYGTDRYDSGYRGSYDSGDYGSFYDDGRRGP